MLKKCPDTLKYPLKGTIENEATVLLIAKLLLESSLDISLSPLKLFPSSGFYACTTLGYRL